MSNKFLTNNIKTIHNPKENKLDNSERACLSDHNNHNIKAYIYS